MPKAKSNVYNITATATITALLVGGKWALAVLPNIEVVSILLAVFATVWGMPWALLASIVFVLTESLLWGFGTWVIAYALYWPLLSILYSILGRYLFKHQLLIKPTVLLGTCTALLCTALFGVITSMVDTIVGYNSSIGFVWALDDILVRFGIMYIRGIPFFVVHIVSNIVLFGVAYYPLSRTLVNIKNRFAINNDTELCT